MRWTGILVGLLSMAGLCSAGWGQDQAGTKPVGAELRQEGGSDWPRYRGPRGDGISTEKGWRAEALLPAPKVSWRVQVGQGYSSVCIAGPRLYTMGYEKGQDIVYCLDVETGRELWKYSYACEAGSYPGPRATPLYADGWLYTVSRTGLLHCLEGTSGKVRGSWIRWRMPMPGRPSGASHRRPAWMETWCC